MTTYYARAEYLDDVYCLAHIMNEKTPIDMWFNNEHHIGCDALIRFDSPLSRETLIELFTFLSNSHIYQRSLDFFPYVERFYGYAEEQIIQHAPGLLRINIHQHDEELVEV